MGITKLGGLKTSKTSKICKKTPEYCVFQCKINIFTDFTGFRASGKPVKSEKKHQIAVFSNAKSIFLLILLVFLVFGSLYRLGPSRVKIVLISMKNQ